MMLPFLSQWVSVYSRSQSFGRARKNRRLFCFMIPQIPGFVKQKGQAPAYSGQITVPAPPAPCAAFPEPVFQFWIHSAAANGNDAPDLFFRAASVNIILRPCIARQRDQLNSPPQANMRTVFENPYTSAEKGSKIPGFQSLYERIDLSNTIFLIKIFNFNQKGHCLTALSFP